MWVHADVDKHTFFGQGPNAYVEMDRELYLANKGQKELRVVEMDAAVHGPPTSHVRMSTNAVCAALSPTTLLNQMTELYT